MNLSLVAILLLCIATSCTKNDAVAPEPVKEHEAPITQQQVANPANPVDEVGKKHNAFLDLYAQRDGDGSYEKTKAILQEFIKSNELQGTDNLMDYLPELIVQFKDHDPFIDPTTGPYGGMNLCEMYPNLCKLFSDGGLIPYSILGDSTLKMRDRVLKFIQENKNREKRIDASQKITDEAKQFALGQYAIARYSSSYWYNKFYSVESVGGGPVVARYSSKYWYKKFYERNGISKGNDGHKVKQMETKSRVAMMSVVKWDVEGFKVGWNNAKKAGKGVFGRLGSGIATGALYSACAVFVNWIIDIFG